jgi:uncharacterized protein (TIGR02284 family)
MDRSHDITVLNSLTKTTLDSMKGYADACEGSDGTYREMFDSMSRERSQVASKLQAQVAVLGGDPEDDSSFTAAAHRTFMDLRAAVTGRDEAQIIKEVERGEDHIKNKYEEALKDGDLTVETRQVIEQGYESVRKGHDRVSAIKHALT